MSREVKGERQGGKTREGRTKRQEKNKKNMTKGHQRNAATGRMKIRTRDTAVARGPNERETTEGMGARALERRGRLGEDE